MLLGTRNISPWRLFGCIPCSLQTMHIVNIHMHAGEPEENEKKALFLLTSLMSKRDNLAHASIYEEFQVSLPYIYY